MGADPAGASTPPGLTALRWLLGAVLAALATVLAAMWVTEGAVTALSLAGALAVVATSAVALARWQHISRRRQLLKNFGGSLQAVRESLDQVRLRALRDEHGQLAAAREVRRQLPVLTLRQATEIARGLDGSAR